MPELIALIKAYGAWVYLLLFAFCAVRTGLLPLLAGAAARVGALDIWLVGCAVAAGAYAGDEGRFYLARRYGERLLTGRPRIGRMVEAARLMLQRYGIAYIFLYRYPMGLRMVGAFPVGLTDMPWPRFSALNAASALVWCGVMVGGGYAIGAALPAAVERHFGVVVAGLLLVFVVVLVGLWRQLARTSPFDRPL